MNFREPCDAPFTFYIGFDDGSLLALLPLAIPVLLLRRFWAHHPHANARLILD